MRKVEAEFVTFCATTAQFVPSSMESITELNDETFDRAFASSSRPVLVDVYAPWCGPCKMIAPLLEQLAEHFAGRVRFFKVNLDEAPGLASRFRITGVPTLLFLSDGEVRDTMVGFSSPRVLVEKLEALAATSAGEVRT